MSCYFQLLRQQLEVSQTSAQEQVLWLCSVMPAFHSALQAREMVLCADMAQRFEEYASSSIQAVSSQASVLVGVVMGVVNAAWLFGGA